MELLMLQLEQISQSQTNATASSLKPSGVEKVHAVKEFIQKNLAGSYSQKDLARMVGTNEYSLRKGFKEVFGDTIFGYWQQLKMKKATQLLLDKSQTIAEISREMGYKNPQHFSTAFKKHFGHSPSERRG